MNVKRFVGKNAREAMAQVRAAWGDDAVVLSNRPIPGGVEIMAMSGQEEVGLQNRAAVARAAKTAAQPASAPAEPGAAMSTLSFERFVRERQRQDAAGAAPQAAAARVAPREPGRFAEAELRKELRAGLIAEPAQAPVEAAPAPQDLTPPVVLAQPRLDPPAPDVGPLVMAQLREMRSMISDQLAGLSWFDTARRSPVQVQTLRLLLGNGFSAALARKLVSNMPPEADETQAAQWLQDAVARNLQCGGKNEIGESGGVFALIGSPGVGKTTTTAKIAAAFAQRHGAASVGLITLDVSRAAPSDTLRAWGRQLGIPVHTARDALSLNDLLGLLERKKLVLVDTAGYSQRDPRRSESINLLPLERVTRVLVLNAAAQAETLDEVCEAYGLGPGDRCIAAKVDEAVKLGPLVDLAIRRKLRIDGLADGQRVPADWHAAVAQTLAARALVKPAQSIFLPQDGELALLLTEPAAPPLQMAPSSRYPGASRAAAH